MKKIILTGFLYLLISVPNFAQEVGEGKISGYMFGDYYYNILRDSTIDNLNNTGLNRHSGSAGF